MFSTFAIKDTNRKIGVSSRKLIDKVANKLKKDNQMSDSKKKKLGDSFFQ